MDATPSKQPPAGWGMKLLVGAAALLVLVAGAAFYLASKKARAPESAGIISITVNADSCDPNELSVPAGRTVFEIVNASKRVVEWEILDGVMVLEERENIAPGISARLTAKLNPGVYEITCGMLNNPRGKLTVTPSAQSAAEAARPPTTAFIGPLAEYQVYLALETEDLIEATQNLSEAIKAGDLDRARSLYEPAREPYLHIAPAAQRFGDLDAAINALPDYFEKREQDPAFSGFHRLEYGLFGQNSLAGLAAVAEKLANDVATVKERIRALKIAPEDIAAGASKWLAKSADAAASGVSERYAHTDQADFEADVAGAAKSFGVLRPLIAKASPDLLARVDAGFKAANASIAALTTGADAGAARAAVAADLRQLSIELAKLNAAIGLD
ncbi:multidrug DMT transporter permease [Methylocella silvestris]|uniref:Multidrug DMT transporter permease n=2 Tax=Methylocella silvestris TaxID=199596 RepID=A0A2J7TIR2_METSI|nr:multidrug DMT transporter permease [Methylocella silvestris]